MKFNYKIWTDSLMPVPTVYIHSFVGNGEDVWKAAHEASCPLFNLVSIFDFQGDNDLTPWPAENTWKGQPPFSGGAEKHLEVLIGELMPEVEKQLPSPSTYNVLVGYSLAGLFTLWSALHTQVFRRIGCVSASFWYPDFTDYLRSQLPALMVDAVYFSLGDKESKTKHPLMRQVEERTTEVVDCIKKAQIHTTFEMNPGNHFKDSDLRTAKAIHWLLTLEG